MSIETRATANTVATIWYKRNGTPGTFEPVSYETGTINVSFAQGGETKYQDESGAMITPRSRYWFESIDENPRRQDYIALGDHSTELDPANVEGAEIIRFVRLDDCSVLNDIDDVYLET